MCNSIDDGELRLYDDPQNREFLMSVMSGRIPKELIAEAKGGEVHVNMEDHKEEEYKKPKASEGQPFLNWCQSDFFLFSWPLQNVMTFVLIRVEKPILTIEDF